MTSVGATSTQREKARRLPDWFRQELPDPARLAAMRERVKQGGLHTVCVEARCPNQGQCWNQGVATVLILGDCCTRACRFCGVRHGEPRAVDPDEPRQVAEFVQDLNLRYVVVTSVTRDDLPDGGSGHFCRTIDAIRTIVPQTRIEVLIPDFGGEEAAIRKIVEAAPDVAAHNLEMVRRLFPQARPQGDYDRSLNVLRRLRHLTPGGIVKSGFMVGLGERDDEIEDILKDLAAVECDVVTIGQYLSPSDRHVPVGRFVEPQQFRDFERMGEALGIRQVVSGPLVRSSYLAESSYRKILDRV